MIKRERIYSILFPDQQTIFPEFFSTNSNNNVRKLIAFGTWDSRTEAYENVKFRFIHINSLFDRYVICSHTITINQQGLTGAKCYVATYC